MQSLDGMTHFVDQALLLERFEVDRADQPRHLDARPTKPKPGPQVRTLFRCRRALELGSLLERHLVEFLDLVDDPEGLPGLVLGLLFSQLLVVELDDLLDRPRPLARLFAKPAMRRTAGLSDLLVPHDTCRHQY